MYLLIVTFVVSFLASVLGLLLYINNGNTLLQPSNKFLGIHHHKVNTPTSGGLVIFPVFVVVTSASTLISEAIITNVSFSKDLEALLWLAIVIAVVFFFIGAIDDLTKYNNGNKGVSIKFRLVVEFLAVALILFISARMLEGACSPWCLLVSTLAIVGGANAFNMVDGIDGGICSVTIPIMVGMLLVSLLEGGLVFTIALFTLTSCMCGFYVLNIKPAKIFLGDSGALPIGAFLSITAISIKMETVFAVMAAIPVITVVCATIQIVVYKICQYRVFGFVPFHHYIERLGVSEQQTADIMFMLSSVTTLLGCLLYLFMRAES